MPRIAVYETVDRRAKKCPPNFSAPLAPNYCSQRRLKPLTSDQHTSFPTAKNLFLLSMPQKKRDLSLHDFFGCADNLFLLSHLCSSGHGAWGQCVPCWGASKTPQINRISAGMPAQPPQMPSPKSTLDLGQGGRFAEGSGKRRKIWPRGRFGLIFGAKPI